MKFNIPMFYEALISVLLIVYASKKKHKMSFTKTCPILITLKCMFQPDTINTLEATIWKSLHYYIT